MDPAMAVAVLSAVIGAAGTVAGAWIQARGRRPGEWRPVGGSGRKAGGPRPDEHQ
jgi:hypothetical protein